MATSAGEVDLNEAQRRALGAVLRLAEETTERIEGSLGRSKWRFTIRLHDDLTPKERDAMRVLCGRLREAIGRAHTALGTEFAERSLRSAIRGEASVLWAAIEDTKSPGLRGYGPLSSEAANAVDGHLGDLSHLVLAVVRTLGGVTGELTAKAQP